MKSKILVTASAAAFVLVLVGTAAYAATALRASTTGADFGNINADGFWKWCPNNGSGNFCQHGGWNHFGTITDTVHTDGDNVYSKVKVDGFSPNSYYGKENGQKSLNIETYDPDVLLTQTATYWVCRDRSAPFSDNCSAQKGPFNR